MRTLEYMAEGVADPESVVATVGNFDGVHRGHRELFARVISRARVLSMLSMVVTFDPHPLKLLAPAFAPPLITGVDEKKQLIAASNIDLLAVIPFSHSFAALSARRFVAEILLERFGIRHLIVGYDYSFGHNREGNTSLLAHLGDELGFGLEIIEPVTSGGIVFSSSAARRMITEGDVSSVRTILGRWYSVNGTVIHGHNRGHDLGYPTANIATTAELLPAEGVYAVFVTVGGIKYQGACSLSTKPTFGESELSLEVFLLDYNGDIYGETVSLYFVARIRESRFFESTDLLVSQITADVAKCRTILAKEDNEEVC